MEKKQYQELNIYLNSYFKSLEQNNSFFLRNIKQINVMSQIYNEFIDNYDLNYKSCTTNLSYNDVYLIAREILESIDPKYLKDFDRLIPSGELNFNYDNSEEYGMHSYIADKKTKLIDINRQYNYNEIIVLIHEYMHYTNFIPEENGSMVKNRYLLSEFISMYFELYATNYLITKKNIDLKEINVFSRFDNTKSSTLKISDYGIPLVAYELFGNIDETTIGLLNNYVVSINNEYFDQLCLLLLDNFKKYGKADNNIGGFLMNEFHYFLGTILAYYAITDLSVGDMVHFNDHINDKNIDTITLLRKNGIDLTDDKVFNKSINNMSKTLQKAINKTL